MDPISSTIVIPSIVNVSCSILVDLFKSYKNRTRAATLLKEVQQFITEFTDGELDSGSFINFLELPSTTRDFVDFINFCAYRRQNSRKKKFILDKESFVEYLSGKARAYVKEEVGRILNINTLKKYFTQIINIIENKLIQKLDTEHVGMLYFVNNSLLETEKRILESLKSEKIIRQNKDFELIKNNYVNIIKKRNKMSHVYGIDELDLYSFYVFPRFYVSEPDESTPKTMRSNIYKKREVAIDWIDIFKESNMVSIIGGAGFGKSLFLKNLINKSNELNIHNPSNLIPIYCDLKQFKINSRNSPSYSIEDFLVDSMISNTGIDKRLISKDFLDYFLSEGRCLILFDALDEVEVEDRADLNELISSFFEVTNKHNKIIITSRAQGFIPRTRIVCNVCPVDKDQIEEYLSKMVKLKQFNQQNIIEFMRQCDVLMESNFLSSLLTVSLLVQIFKAEKELPESKIDLYDKCVEYISKKREKDQKKSSFDFKLMSNILDNNISFEKLSWLARPNNIEIKEDEIKKLLLDIHEDSYSSRNETRIAIGEFLKFCAQRTELYVAGNQDAHYKFFHRSFYEYFYSKCIINEFPNNEDLLNELLKFGIDSEMFELTIALLKKQNYDRFKGFVRIIYELIEKSDDFEELELQSEFLKLCLMLDVSEQLQLCDKVYRLCFNEKKVLAKLQIEGTYNILLPLFKKVSRKIGRDLEKDTLLLYKEEIIAAHLIKKLIKIKDLVQEISLNFIFGALEFEIDRMNLLKLLDLYTLDELCSLMKNYIELDSSKEIILRKQIEKYMKTLNDDINRGQENAG
ncbi:NACHT domain-containing protein [Paenibacillus lautus]